MKQDRYELTAEKELLLLSSKINSKIKGREIEAKEIIE